MTAKVTNSKGDPAPARSGREFHLFIYGPNLEGRRPDWIPEGCRRVDRALVTGTLYEVDGSHPALVLAGPGSVEGEVWLCPVEVLVELDADEWVQSGLLRRVGVQVGDYPCWTYVAGPKMAMRMVPIWRQRADSAELDME